MYKTLALLVAATLCGAAFAQETSRMRSEVPATVERGMIVNIFQQPAPSPGVEISVALPVTFAFGASQLTPEGRSILTTTALALNAAELMGLRFVVEGHTDVVGSDQTNLVLSQRRADAARAFLITQGVAAERLVAIGYGQSRLIAGVAPNDGRQRRVEIVKLER